MPRKTIPARIKCALLREAGGKCSNPGCPNTLTELHHINQWHVYQTHDQAQMIAVCPTCHSHAHRGQLIIDDDTIRRWKLIRRSTSDRGHIYVEPGDTCRVLLGSIHITNGPANRDAIMLFRLSPA